MKNKWKERRVTGQKRKDQTETASSPPTMRAPAIMSPSVCVIIKTQPGGYQLG